MTKCLFGFKLDNHYYLVFNKHTPHLHNFLLNELKIAVTNSELEYWKELLKNICTVTYSDIPTANEMSHIDNYKSSIKLPVNIYEQYISELDIIKHNMYTDRVSNIMYPMIIDIEHMLTSQQFLYSTIINYMNNKMEEFSSHVEKKNNDKWKSILKPLSFSFELVLKSKYMLNVYEDQNFHLRDENFVVDFDEMKFHYTWIINNSTENNDSSDDDINYMNNVDNVNIIKNNNDNIKTKSCDLSLAELSKFTLK